MARRKITGAWPRTRSCRGWPRGGSRSGGAFPRGSTRARRSRPLGARSTPWSPEKVVAPGTTRTQGRGARWKHRVSQPNQSLSPARTPTRSRSPIAPRASAASGPSSGPKLVHSRSLASGSSTGARESAGAARIAKTTSPASATATAASASGGPGRKRRVLAHHATAPATARAAKATPRTSIQRILPGGAPDRRVEGVDGRVADANGRPADRLVERLHARGGLLRGRPDAQPREDHGPRPLEDQDRRPLGPPARRRPQVEGDPAGSRSQDLPVPGAGMGQRHGAPQAETQVSIK